MKDCKDHVELGDCNLEKGWVFHLDHTIHNKDGEAPTYVKVVKSRLIEELVLAPAGASAETGAPVLGTQTKAQPLTLGPSASLHFPAGQQLPPLRAQLPQVPVLALSDSPPRCSNAGGDAVRTSGAVDGLDTGHLLDGGGDGEDLPVVMHCIRQVKASLHSAAKPYTREEIVLVRAEIKLVLTSMP